MMMMNPEVEVEDHEMVLLSSQYYPDQIYPQFVPQQGITAAAAATGGGNSKPRRRRKKNKGCADGVLRKRKLSEEQVNLLEQSFGDEHKLESERKDRLAAELGLDPRQVAVWFQNRRARWKSKKLEEEYSKLKSQHDSAIIDKCRLESELVKLKEQLNNAKREIQQLNERLLDGFSSNSPSSSFSMELEGVDRHPSSSPYWGDLGMDGIYDHTVNYAAPGTEWDNLFYL